MCPVCKNRDASELAEIESLMSEEGKLPPDIDDFRIFKDIEGISFYIEFLYKNHFYALLCISSIISADLIYST